MFAEKLEQRRLFALTITEGYPNYFEVYGTSGADNIHITVSPPIFGTNQIAHVIDNSVDPPTDTVLSRPDFYFSIVVYEGDDTVLVEATGGDVRPSATGLSGGLGDDTLEIKSLGGGIWGGGGNDLMKETNDFRGEMYGEDGNDYMYCYGDSLDARADGGNGNDWIDFSNVFHAGTPPINGASIRGGWGDDSIWGTPHDDQIYGDGGRDRIWAGGGDDVVFAADNERDMVWGGAGDDTLYCDKLVDGSPWELSINGFEYVNPS